MAASPQPGPSVHANRPADNPAADDDNDRPQIPRFFLVAALPHGVLSIGYLGDACWRVSGDDASPLRDALTAGLTACGAPGMPMSPDLLQITSEADGGLHFGGPGERRWYVEPDKTGPIRRAVAEAIVRRAAQSRPSYERATP